jgi:hypothetical protein|tara:strand:+ start:6419 stop:6937 length:519 start_codon:yes stop_codon:yes gene_type:complete
MAEKKHVVNELRLSYNGPLSIEEFYAEVAKWMDEKGMQKDLKKKSEDVASKGKKIEWIIEAWKEATHVVRYVIRIRALFDNVKESRIKRKGHNIRINQADALIVIDGFVETELKHQWTANPLTIFFRTLFDKYIWNIGSTETERLEGPATDLSYDLHKRLKAFFELYKMKVK